MRRGRRAVELQGSCTVFEGEQDACFALVGFDVGQVVMSWALVGRMRRGCKE